MGLIVEGRIESPLLQEALAAGGGVTLELVDLRTLDAVESRFLYWVVGPDDAVDAFEVGLEEDPTVEDHRVLADVDDRSLVRVTLSEAGRRAATYEIAWEQDIVVLDLTVTRGGMHVVARLPTREALLAYRDGLVERDIPFNIERLFREEGDEDLPDSRFGVTTAQREALLAAFEAGYFAVPRETELKAVAEEVSISSQALSARLRRGQAALIRNTLALETT